MRWTRICIIFSFGWFAGSIFVMLILGGSFIDSRSGLRGSSFNFPTGSGKESTVFSPLPSKLIEGGTRMFQSISRTKLTELPFVIPRWGSLSENDTVSFPLYFSWGMDARLFSPYNYKVLESVIGNYPSAQVIVHRSSAVHACDIPISKELLVKYAKLGYNVGFSSDEQLSQVLRSEYGGDFWSRWIGTGCILENCLYPLPPDLFSQLQRNEIRQPYFAELYQHIISLWRSGGIYNDFSYYFLGHIEEISIGEGYRIQTLCGLRSSRLPRYCSSSNSTHRQSLMPRGSSKLVDSNKQKRFRSWSQSRLSRNGALRSGGDKQEACRTSTLLVFRQAYSNTLDCVLRHYADPSFHQCLSLELSFEEISTGTRRHSKIVDGNSELESEGVGNTSGKKVYRWTSGQGAACIKQAFEDCFAELGNENIIGHENARGILEGFEDNQISALSLIRNNSLQGGWRLPQSAKIIWLGSDPSVAFGADYQSPNSLIEGDVGTKDFHGNENLYEGSIIAMASKNVVLHDHRSPPDPNSFPLCQFYSQSSFKNGDQVEPCSPSVIIPGFARSACGFITSALVAHPNVLPQLYGTGVYDIGSLYRTKWYRGGSFAYSIDMPTERDSILSISGHHCYPTDSASVSHLFSDEEFVKAFYTDQGGIGGTFSKNRATPSPSKNDIFEMRKFCFPHIEKSEYFTSLHTDSSYAVEYKMPFRFRRDSPQAKALFVIRNPVERLYSHYKHIYSIAKAHAAVNGTPPSSIRIEDYMPRLDVLIEMATSRLGPIGRLRVLLSESEQLNGLPVHLELVIKEYYSIVERYNKLLSIGPAEAFLLMKRTGGYWAVNTNVSDFKDYLVDDNGVLDARTYKWVLRAVPSAAVLALNQPEEYANKCGICSVFTIALALSYELMVHSIYLPPIIHYGDVLGMENILVINSDDLNPADTRRFQRIMSAIYLFLDLPRFDISAIELLKDDPTDSAIPPLLQLSKQGHRRLSAFFSVFTDKLTLATGLNLTAWSLDFPPAGAPRQNAMVATDTLLNQTDAFNGTGTIPLLPPAWYETSKDQSVVPSARWSGFNMLWKLAGLRDVAKSATGEPAVEYAPESVLGGLEGKSSGWKDSMGKVIAAFLPKEKFSEDSRFNTTIGMLSSF